MQALKCPGATSASAGTAPAQADSACGQRVRKTQIANQLRIQARTGGWAVPMLDDAATGGDLRPLVDHLLRHRAAASAAPFGLTAAEQFRVVRFGGLQSLLDRFGHRLRS